MKTLPSYVELQPFTLASLFGVLNITTFFHVEAVSLKSNHQAEGPDF
jgi:hypothetical protein